MVPGSSPLVALPARRELGGMLDDPLGEEASGAAGEGTLDDLAGRDVDLGLVVAVAGVDVGRRVVLFDTSVLHTPRTRARRAATRVMTHAGPVTLWPVFGHRPTSKASTKPLWGRTGRYTLCGQGVESGSRPARKAEVVE